MGQPVKKSLGARDRAWKEPLSTAHTGQTWASLGGLDRVGVRSDTGPLFSTGWSVIGTEERLHMG